MSQPYPVLVERASLGLGRRLALARKARGFSQRDLAAAAGVGLSTVVGAENGHPGVALGNVLKMLDVLGLLPQIDLLLDPEKDAMVTAAGVKTLMPLRDSGRLL